ncbi:hypothetical protein C2E20_8429 [Micractinium conductrix]|uniref:Uncharacterized protein n=1 Tax=Micractinium conductrix TaxID=554055 RepID=A0A2P6V1C1_9CHLO|nr:hypothetical protein C2E20_8429 [Micractinium conductrix]|eukprot:PSC67892.1 hypothetical protein C2E20_8429 [Micractinium conductrix]
MNRGAGKKRKASSDDSERTLYSAFSHAANAVSQLYTAAAQQAKRSEEAGARQALERVAQFVVKEYGNAPAVPTAVLMEVLRQELQAAQGSAAAIQLPFPVPLLPTDSSEDVHSDDEALMSAEPTPSTFRRSANGPSPPKSHRSSSTAPGQLPAFFQQQQQAAQAAHMAQMVHAMAMQQHQQQQQQAQQQGFSFPGQPYQH